MPEAANDRAAGRANDETPQRQLAFLRAGHAIFGPSGHVVRRPSPEALRLLPVSPSPGDEIRLSCDTASLRLDLRVARASLDTVATRSFRLTSRSPGGFAEVGQGTRLERRGEGVRIQLDARSWVEGDAPEEAIGLTFTHGERPAVTSSGRPVQMRASRFYDAPEGNAFAFVNAGQAQEVGRVDGWRQVRVTFVRDPLPGEVVPYFEVHSPERTGNAFVSITGWVREARVGHRTYHSGRGRGRPFEAPEHADQLAGDTPLYNADAPTEVLGVTRRLTSVQCIADCDTNPSLVAIETCLGTLHVLANLRRRVGPVFEAN